MTRVADTAIQIAEGVRAGNVSASEVTEHFLAKARQSKPLNAFLSLHDNALTRARELDERRKRGGTLGKLAGVPIAIKDAICTHDAPTTAASKILTRQGTHESGWVPHFDATVVERLRAADAIVLGKTNMDEFAMGSSNENSGFGVVHNPWCPGRIPGGSSGGSAAAVASGAAPAALGSDTGGSIRQPAALCGLVGVKPSYGRVSRFGLVAFASSLDQVGPMTLDVRSSARILEVLAGPCPRDSTCSDNAVGAYEAACDAPAAGLRVGVPHEYFAEGLDPEVHAAIKRVLESLKDAGCQIQELSLPHTRYGISSYYLVATAEASSNLSRFDGVRYGLREPSDSLAGLYAATRELGFGAEVKRRIMLGTYALSSGYYDAYYRKAQQVRTLIRQDFEAAFQQVDVLVTPSSPTPAFEIGERSDPLQMYLADVYTLPASLAGLCGLSMPAGMTNPTDSVPELPIGVQMLAPAFAEETLFRAAAQWERVRGPAPTAPAR